MDTLSEKANSVSTVPCAAPNKPSFLHRWILPASILRSLFAYAAQGFGKCILGEGERLALLGRVQHGGQAAAAAAANVGALVARILFAPMEEVAFAMFAKMDKKKGISFFLSSSHFSFSFSFFFFFLLCV